MLRLALRSLLARKLRLALSASAVVLGVSFVAGAYVLTDTLGAAFTSALGTVNENVAVDVRGAAGEDRRPEVPDAAVAAVEQVDGVAEVRPVVRAADAGRFGVLGRDGTVLSGTGAPMVAGSWVASDRLGPQRVADGREPRGADEVALDTALAAKAEVRVGDRATVFTPTGQREVRVVGLTRYPDGSDSVGGESYVFFTAETARAALGVRAWTDLYVAADPGVDADELRARVQAALPDRTEAVTGAQLADEQAADLEEGLAFLSTFLLVFAAVALFVATFLIVNTFSILVAQRTRELALLRALGASRRQVTGSVLLEAVLVGAVASVVGLGVGIGVAAGLQAAFGAFGAGLPSAAPVVRPRTVLAALAVGTLVTAGAVLLPARRAAAVPPVAAMRDAATGDRSLRRQTASGAVLAAAGVVGMVLGLTGTGLAVLGAGTALAFLGIALLSPLASRPVTGGLGRLFTRSLPGRLGRQNSLRDPRRTAVTAAALMVGVALVAAVGVLGASLSASVRQDAGSALTADYVLTPTAVGMGPEAYDAVRGTPGVGAVTGLRSGTAQVDGRDAALSTLDRGALGRTVELTGRGGRVADLGPGTLLVAADVAADRGLTVGRTVPVTFADGATERLRVAGLYAPNRLLGGYLADSSAAAHFDGRLYAAALVTAADGTDPAGLRAALERSLQPYRNVQVQDPGQFADEATGQVDQLVQFLQLLLAMSVGIAVLGVVNTLALSVLERTRELGLLRAVGMSRRQVRRMVQVEAVLVAVFGGLLGLAVGVAIGVALQRALADRGVAELSLPVLQLLGCLALAAAAGVGAAWLPARRAARLDVLTAVSTG